jgi:hypothetical protein
LTAAPVRGHLLVHVTLFSEQWRQIVLSLLLGPSTRGGQRLRVDDPYLRLEWCRCVRTSDICTSWHDRPHSFRLRLLGSVAVLAQAPHTSPVSSPSLGSPPYTRPVVDSSACARALVCACQSCSEYIYIYIIYSVQTAATKRLLSGSSRETKL